MKYFQDHVDNSVFNNQGELARLLGKYNKRNLIESDEINPLTVRLFSVKGGLDRVSDCAGRLAVRPFPIDLQQMGYSGPPPKSFLTSTVAPSGSIQYFHAYLTSKNYWNGDLSPIIAGMQDYRIDYPDDVSVRMIEKQTWVHTFDLYSGIYDFFSNLDSCFDRVRLELNSIYFDGHKELDPTKSNGNKYWGQYLGLKNKAIVRLNSKGYSAITSVLTGTLSTNLDQRTSKYRNRLIHDGDLEIKTDINTGVVYLPDNPLAIKLNFATEMIPFITKIYGDVQALFHDIYASIITDVRKAAKIPLI